MHVPAYWFDRTVTVSPYLGSGGMGDVYGDAFTARANVDSSRKVVVTTGGDEVVSETTLRMPPRVRVAGSLVPTLEAVPEQSQITVDGREVVAQLVKPFTAYGRVVYVEVATS